MTQSAGPEWVNALCDEIRRRWRHGDPVRVEDYRKSEARLSSSTDALLILIEAEVAARLEAGETPSIEEYVQRFPELADSLPQWLQSRRIPLAADLYETRARASSAEGPGSVALPPTLLPVAPPGDSYGTIDHVTPVVDEATPPAKDDSVETLAPQTGEESERTTDYFATTPPEGDLPSTRLGDRPPPLASLGLPTIGGYVVLGELGKGGMGVVYKAEQAGLKRLVALKMILSGAGARSEELTRFRLEAEAIARIKHPNIVQVYEIGDHQGQPFFSLEYVEGGSLAGRLRESLLPPKEAARLSEALARAIHAAHLAGVVHRDLKPANVLMAADGTPKVTDFGLAKDLGTDVGKTHAGQVMGTPSYMAPEQASGRIEEIGPPADTYALGGILYEMLAGRAPFKGATVLETLEQVRTAIPIPPSRLQPHVPRDLETICLKCLEKEPARRYSTALDLAEDLRRFREGEPIQARRASPWERTVKWVRRNPSKAGAVAASVLAALVTTTLLAQQIGRRVQLAQSRLETQELLVLAQEDKRNRKYEDALGRLNLALGTIGKEPALADLLEPAQEARAEVETELRRQSTTQEHQAQFRAFRKLRKAVLYHETMFTLGEHKDEEKVRQIRKAAREALALYNITLTSQGRPDVHTLLLDQSDRAEIIPGCYEVLLAHAEAVAAPLSGENREDQANDAIAILKRAEDLSQSSKAYHVRLARYLDQADKKAESLAEKQRADARAPEDVSDLFLMGVDQYRAFVNGAAGDALPHAVEYLEHALRRRPDHFWSSYTLGVCYLRQNDWSAARARFDHCIGLQERDELGDFLWPYLLRGSANAKLGKYAEAEADFARAESMKPDASVRYGILVNRGMALYLQKDLVRAERELRKAIELNPQQYPAFASLGGLCVEHGASLKDAERQARLAQAQECLDRALALKPLAAQYRTRARLHLLREEFGEALVDLRKAIARHDGGKTLALAEDHVECGRILFQDKRFDKARDEFEAAIQSHPDSFPPAHRLKAEALLEMGRFEESITEFDRYLEKGKPLGDVLRARGLAHAKLHQHQKAADDYTQALDLDYREKREPSLKTLSFRAWAYVLCDAPRLADKDFQEVLRREPDNADALVGRANTRVVLGDTKGALLDAEAALQKGGSERVRCMVARVYAQAATRADWEVRDLREPGTTLPTPKDPKKLDPKELKKAADKLRRRYEDRAVTLLEQALLKLPEGERARFWRLYVQPDPALKALKTVPGYLRMADRYAVAEMGK